jgi:hypothetical protein
MLKIIKTFVFVIILAMLFSIANAGGYKCYFMGYTGSGQLVIAKGRNDGINRLYNVGNYPYEFTWNGSGWTKDTLAEQPCYSRAITAGYGRNDSICRLYTGSTFRGDIDEFTFNGSSWDSAKVKIGNYEDIRCLEIGDIKNDDTLRLVAGCYDSTTIAYTYEEGGGIWKVDTLGIKRQIVQDISIGKGRNDDTNRVYVNGGPFWIEYSYRNDWDTTFHLHSYETTGIMIADVKIDGTNRLYLSRAGHGLWEYEWDGMEWLESDTVDTNFAERITMGDGRNDGKQRIYAGYFCMALGDTLSDFYVFEYSYEGGEWVKDTLDTLAYNFGFNFYIMSVVVGDARNDGKNRVYAVSDLGHLFEWEWDDSLNGVAGRSVYSDRVFSLKLNQNYPNPFKQSTVIRYQVTGNGPINLSVYNIAGQLVRVLVNETSPSCPSPNAFGEGRVRWNGRDESGRAVANGVYVYRLSVGGQSRTKKMILIR